MNILLLKERDPAFYRGLKWLITLRTIFGIVLLSSGFIARIAPTPSISLLAFGLVFFISILIIFFSIIYAVFLPRIRNGNSFAYLQIIIDSFLITLIIFATGGPESFFHFLYLLVIMYSSLLIGRKAAIIIAALSSLQYLLLIVIESFGFAKLLGPEFYYHSDLKEVFYKIFSAASGCFIIAYLGSLLTDQARKAKKDLEEMEKHVKRVERLAFAGEMAAGLAHEIKNPLAALSGSVQILKDEISDKSENYRLIQIILRETDRLNNLVSTFLSLSIQKQGDPKLVNVSNIIEEVVALFRKDHKASGILFSINSCAECQVYIDSDHLRQILWNLIQNSADALSEKIDDAMIEVSCSLTSDKRVMLAIKDNGSGMSQEAISSVFTPFYTTKPAGNGLGLCIVHRMLANYDARIDITSKEGFGTEIRMFFKKGEFQKK